METLPSDPNSDPSPKEVFESTQREPILLTTLQLSKMRRAALQCALDKIKNERVPSEGIWGDFFKKIDGNYDNWELISYAGEGAKSK